MTTNVDETERQNRQNGLEYMVSTCDEVEEIIPGIRVAAEELRKIDFPKRFFIVKTMMEKWRDKTYPARKKVLSLLAEETGYPIEMIEYFAFSSFGQMTKIDQLFKLQPSEFSECFRSFSEVDNIEGVLLRSRGSLSPIDKLRFKSVTKNYNFESLLEEAPKFITSICAGNVPGLPIHQMNLALVLGSASLIKNSSHETLLGPAYLESMISELDTMVEKKEISKEERDTVERAFKILTWDSKNSDITQYVIENSDAVILTGGDKAVESVEEIIKDSGKPILYDPHGHKAGLIIVSREFLTDEDIARKIARCSAIDLTAWNQYACLSPREIRIESGGYISPEKFSEMLAEEMICVGEKFGTVTNGTTLKKLDSKHKMYLGSDAVVKSRPDKLGYGLVIYREDDPSFDPYSEVCQDRTVFVKPMDDIYDILNILKPYGEKLQTISVAISKERIIPYAERLSGIGVSNIHSVGNAAFPRIGEPWDGKFIPFNLLNPLFNKIRWTGLSADIDGDIQYALDRFDNFTPTKYGAQA